MLARYNDVVPNGAERIVAMAESQLNHRQELERSVVRGNIKAEARGQIMALLITLLVVGSGVGLILTGHSVEGFGSILTILTALVGVFVYGRRAQRAERDDKMRNTDQR